MVLRAKEPKRSALSSCAGPKTRRKSLARNLPNLLAAIAVIVFTGHLRDGRMLPCCEETGRRKTPAGRLPRGLAAILPADTDEALQGSQNASEFQGIATTISENS